MSEEILNAKIMFGSGDIPEYQNEAVKNRINELSSELEKLTCTISNTEVFLAVTCGIMSSLINTALKGPFNGADQWKIVDVCKNAVTLFCQKIPFLKIKDFDDAARFLVGNALVIDRVIKEKTGVSAVETYQDTKADISGSTVSFLKSGTSDFMRMFLKDVVGIEVGLDANGKGTLSCSNKKKLTGDELINATSNVAAVWFLGQCVKPLDLIPEIFKPFVQSLKSVIDEKQVAAQIKELLCTVKPVQKMKKVKVNINVGEVRDKIVTAAPAAVLNEALLKGIYAAETAMRGRDKNDKNYIFDERNYKRMRTIATSTLSFCDGGDAAIRAAMTCGGNVWAFLGKFALNINYVALGETAVAIYKDSVDEKAEQQGWMEMADLKIQFAEEYIPQLVAYRKKLDEDLGKYIEEEAIEILTNLEDMQAAAEANDSDAFIKINVDIQEKNGAISQFTSQKEFDELMASDTPLEF